MKKLLGLLLFTGITYTVQGQDISKNALIFNILVYIFATNKSPIAKNIPPIEKIDGLKVP